MITARELDVERLPAPAQVWVNLALKYTHGYGVVAVPVNEMDTRGNPVLWAHDIPVEAKKVSRSPAAKFTSATSPKTASTCTLRRRNSISRKAKPTSRRSTGNGGILLSNFWRKLVIARQFDGPRLFISNYFTPESRVMLRRNIVERAHTLAPFLTFDHDPYIVADADHYSYILDAYTTSETYPYSEAYHGSLATFPRAQLPSQLRQSGDRCL